MDRDLLNLKNSILSSLEHAKNLPNSQRKTRELVNSSKILKFINEKVKFNPQPFIKGTKKIIQESDDWIDDIKNTTFLPKNKLVSIIPEIKAKVAIEKPIIPLDIIFNEPSIENVKFIVDKKANEEQISEMLKRLTPLNVIVKDEIKNLEDYYEYSWTK